MPLYFFDTADGGPPILDTVGLELPDDETARRHGIAALPDMARDALPDGDTRSFSVVIRDVTRRVIYVADLVLTGRWMI